MQHVLATAQTIAAIIAVTGLLIFLAIGSRLVAAVLEDRRRRRAWDVADDSQWWI